MEGDSKRVLSHLPSIVFQSTPSAWRETKAGANRWTKYGISIHSLRMEGDLWKNLPVCGAVYFNPLPPHGGRPVLSLQHVRSVYISIHSLRMEGDIV